jgi:replicative DNA helicase Mcm
MNPSDNRFDNTRSVASQIDLPASLLSRFDLIFALKDKQNEENDRNVAKAMFNGRDGRLSATEYTNEQITKYIMYARYKVREMTTSPEAESLLTDKFIDLRKINKNNTGEDVIAITFRQLDGAARLAEAHAKMRLSNVVEEKDAEVAISIIEHYIKTMCVDDQGYVTTDMVMGGRSKSEKDKSNDLLSMLQRIAEEDLYTRTYTFDELMGKLDNSIDKVTLKKHLEKYHDMGKIYYSGDKKIKIHRV